MKDKQPDEILAILAADARTTPEKIAAMTGRPVDEIEKAIKAFEKSGVIKRYKTIIDWEKVGVERVYAFIDVKVQPARDVGFDAVAERIYRFPEVQSLWLISGGNDLRVVVQEANLRELGRFVAEKLATIDGVMGTATHFVMKKYKEDESIFVEQTDDERLVVTP
ncbi:MAG TPA: Lrp/AsnC family transcriptional regulator [Oculatellaceae cyanobacterium]